ncbi:hypothetical protein WN944_026376 [Citrus x changshan-huyou]|uniref:HAT C-terminal dimerisation domain-containing protein n=1 Tax=Citrus x changshan-huyou TaxID=2935761 RepID=A0AAP0LSE1_9ROSI
MAMVKPGTIGNGVITGCHATSLTQVSNGKYMLNLACLKACVEGLELQEKSIIGSSPWWRRSKGYCMSKACQRVRHANNLRLMQQADPTADYVRRDGDEGCEIWIRKRRFVSYVLVDGDGLVVSLSRSGFGFHRSQPKSNRLIEAHRWKYITICTLPHLSNSSVAATSLQVAKMGWQKSPRGRVPSGIFPIRGGYPTLARIARDILAIPITTVASESAFSTGGRVVSPHRNKLHPSTLEALMCCQSWLRAYNSSLKYEAISQFATFLEEEQEEQDEQEDYED